MSNDKLTFKINKYIRSTDPQSVTSITESLVKLVVRNFDNQTVDKLVKILGNGTAAEMGFNVPPPHRESHDQEANG